MTPPATVRDDTDLLTIGEAHAALRVSRATLFRLIRRRELGVVRIAGRTFVERAEIHRLVDARRAPAATAASDRIGRIGSP